MLMKLKWSLAATMTEAILSETLVGFVYIIVYLFFFCFCLGIYKLQRVFFVLFF